MARKRGEKSCATRTSSASAFVVRQQTKQGRWLQLRVTLASYNTSSGRLVLSLNHVLDYEPTDYPHSTTASPVADYMTQVLNDQIHGPFSKSEASPQTTHCEEILLPQKVESPTASKLHTRRSASELAQSSPFVDTPDMKMTLSRCWVTTDVQLAWAGSFDPDTDRACSWQINGRRPKTDVANEWSKPYGHLQASDAFIGYQDDSCQHLQQLLNCDSSYMVTQSAHVTNQSEYVDLVDRNVVYEN